MSKRYSIPQDVKDVLKTFNYSAEQFAELDEIASLYEQIYSNVEQNPDVMNGQPFCERSRLVDRKNGEKVDELLDMMRSSGLTGGDGEAMIHSTGRPKKLVMVESGDPVEALSRWTRFVSRLTEGTRNPRFLELRDRVSAKVWVSRKTFNWPVGSAVRGQKLNVGILQQLLSQCKSLSDVEMMIDEYLIDPKQTTATQCPLCNCTFNVLPDMIVNLEDRQKQVLDRI